jgi:hypothetical protein
MKKIYPDKILNIKNTPLDDKKFFFEIYDYKKIKKSNIEIIFMSDLLEKEKNLEMLEKSKTKPAMWEQVYSRETELKNFKNLFETAIKNNKKIHII